jgi:hypothetical protein
MGGRIRKHRTLNIEEDFPRAPRLLTPTLSSFGKERETDLASSRGSAI